MRVFYGDNVKVLPIFNYVPPTLDNAKIEEVRKWFLTQMGEEYPQA
jgi:hypothetical protein